MRGAAIAIVLSILISFGAALIKQPVPNVSVEEAAPLELQFLLLFESGDMGGAQSGIREISDGRPYQADRYRRDGNRSI